MKEYLNLISQVLENGTKKTNRTGTDTLMVFGYHYKINLQDGFPLITTKKVYFNSVIRELLWYLSGETHIRHLRQHTKIWDAWTSEEKNLEVCKMYGYQWVNWDKYEPSPNNGTMHHSHINQIQNVMELIKINPESRRMVVSAWNPAVLD